MNRLKLADETRAHVILYGAKRAALMLGVRVEVVYQRLNRAGMGIRKKIKQPNNQGGE